VFVEGLTFSFTREPSANPVRKVGSRWVVCHWASQIETAGAWSKFILHEFNDGVYEPSSLLGVFTDFAGAAAVEVTVRWLQRTNDERTAKTRRQRDMFLGALAVTAALALAAISFR
jgi:hypothetical protein